MRICVLEAEEHKGRLRAKWGPYTDMFAAWLKPYLPDAAFIELNIAEGAMPPEDATEFDGYLVTGSLHGAYDALPWIARLEDFLRSIRAANIPVAGVCFGHQIMAQAYGGRVEKSDQGWQIGRIDYAGLDVSMLAFHQDQVVEEPGGATVIASNPACPIAGLAYDFPALSVQFHPEFDPQFIREILDRMQGEAVPMAVAEKARNGLFDPVATRRVGEMFAAFYQKDRSSGND